jgi:hypothetical protein
MVLGNWYGPMEITTRANFVMENAMGKERESTKTAVTTMVNMKMINLVGGEFINGQMERVMKAVGKMVCFMGKA